jgi:tetratricopeptide (TPR) repeat protein
MVRILAALLVLGLMVGTAQAVIPAGDALYDAGAYARAVNEYLRENTAPALARAARATSMLAATGPEADRIRTYEQAAALAQRAIEADERYPEGHFELARAYGRLAQFKGILSSLNLAPRVRRALERTLELHPDHVGALVALGLWHLEVPGLFGGNRSRTLPMLERAVELEPDSIINRVEYAGALERFNRRADAIAQLEIALRLQPNTAPQRLDFEKAQRLLEDLRSRR